MAQYGTLTTLDTLQAIRNTTVAIYGEDRTFTSIQVAMEAHSRIEADIISDLVEFTSDQLRYSGAYSSFKAEKLGQFGRPQPQKIAAGDNLGFPVDRWGNALQWTKDWFRLKSVAEMAAQVQAILDADEVNIQLALKSAVFVSANYTFADWLQNNINIPVKRLANADGFPIPPAPDGSTFNASTHTHYLARAGGSLAASDVSALIATVREHFATGAARLYINAGAETTIRGFTSNFVPYYDNRVTVANTITRGNVALDVLNTYDRAIGLFDSAEVWVKPWIPVNYMFAFLQLPGPTGKVLAFRTLPAENGTGSLTLVSDIDEHPLRSEAWQREFGVGVANRVAGASLYTGGTSYVDPTLT